MKKLLAVLLLITLFATMVACKKDDVDPAPDNSGTPQTSDTQAPDNTDDQQKPADSTPSDTSKDPESLQDVWNNIDKNAVDDPADTNWTPRY